MITKTRPNNIFKGSWYQPHPARVIGFDRLYTELEKRVQQKLINKQTDGELVIYTYTNECNYSKAWDVYTIIARGLILDLGQKEVVATPFPKFFNYGEISAHLPKCKYEVQEKMDGSLGILFHHNNQWKIATKGSFQSEQAQEAKKILDETISIDSLQKGWTYLVEIIYPENKIVVDYQDKRELVYLTSYDPYGYEDSTLNPAFLHYPCKFDGYTIDDLIYLAKEKLDKDQEGFVIRFHNGYRLKIKSEEYVRVHRLISDLTPLNIWRALKDCDNLDAIKMELPEETWDEFDKIRHKLEMEYINLRLGVGILNDKFKNYSDKELGKCLKNRNDKYSKFLFPARKSNWFKEIEEPGRKRDQVFKTFRPTGNKLDV